MQVHQRVSTCCTIGKKEDWTLANQGLPHFYTFYLPSFTSSFSTSFSSSFVSLLPSLIELFQAQDAYNKSKAEPQWQLLQRDVSPFRSLLLLIIYTLFILLDSSHVLVDGSSFSGFILSKLVFLPSPEAGAISRNAMQPPPMRSYQMRAYIYQATNLYSAGILFFFNLLSLFLSLLFTLLFCFYYSLISIP